MDVAALSDNGRPVRRASGFLTSVIKYLCAARGQCSSRGRVPFKIRMESRNFDDDSCGDCTNSSNLAVVLGFEMLLPAPPTLDRFRATAWCMCHVI